MTDRCAKTAFLSEPEPGLTFLLNVQDSETCEVHRWQINRNQLLELNHQTADILRRAFK